MKPLFILIASFIIAAPLYANDSPDALQESFLTALRAGDMAGIADCYAEDATSYDVGVQVLHGPEAIAGSWGGFFDAYEVLEANLFNNTTDTHGDTGLAWGEFKLNVKPKAGGEAFDMVGRFTDVSRNINGKWVYVLDHVSMVPPAAE